MMYDNVPKIWLAAQESTDDNPVLVPFTYGEALENVPVVPDFSQGDMLVTMPDGYLARSAVAIKPETLIPENIAEGVTIAGIEGRFKSGLSGRGIEYTHDANGDIIAAKLIDMPTFTGVLVPTLVSVDASESPNITEVPTYAANKVETLETVILPENIIKIQGYAFYSCTKLKNITIPAGVDTIQSYAFRNCISLETIVIPAAMKLIGYGAFQGCTALKSMVFEDPTGWFYSSGANATSGTNMTPSDPATAAEWLTTTYANKYWNKGT